jgi:2-oxoisovalerate dehydrogenase E1 component
MLVQKTLLAAAQIERRRPDVSIEVLDLRTLAPYDWACIAGSVQKTSRVVIAHEDCLSFGYGAETGDGNSAIRRVRRSAHD